MLLSMAQQLSALGVIVRPNQRPASKVRNPS
jgi:hypothetical protein